MACVSPFKLHLRLSSHIPKPSRQLPTFDLGPRDSFAKSRWFRRSQLQQKWLKFALADGEHVPARMRKSEKKGWGCSVARCTAEGMERELFVGRREGVFTAAERFKVVALVAAVMCLCNADRVVMSVAIVPLAAKHGWNSSFLGIVQSLVEPCLIDMEEKSDGMGCCFLVSGNSPHSMGGKSFHN